MPSANRTHRVLWLGLVLVALVGVASCGAPANPNPVQRKGPLRPPPKPGESITHTKMCSCEACEPAVCCRELEQDVPETSDCAEGYDFSKCGLSVSSCEASCFQHRWRIRVEQTCQEGRPPVCCHDR